MRRYISLICALFLVSMIALPAFGAADAQSEEKESEPVTPVSKEEPSDKDGVITNSIGMKFRLIEAGQFMMGSEKVRLPEQPVHAVRITKPFYIGVYEVTQEQYKKVMGKNPSYFKGPNRPVEFISWDEAVMFCEKLSKKEGVNYRLPTEAEWEYACRAGTKTEYYWGDEIDGEYAWYCENSEKDKTHDVGQKKPNAWGLYDMSGNVYEWCSDQYAKDYYDTSPEKDPQGPKDGELRVMRGGASGILPGGCRSAYRYGVIPESFGLNLGFRIVRAPKNVQSEEKETETATSVSMEEPSNEDGVITNSIGMKLKLIEAGEFMMGSEKGGAGEKPVHKVKITKAKPEKFICLDGAFGGNDQIKTNTALQMEAENIEFKVI